MIYEHYTENNPVEKNTVAGKVAKAKEKELEEWLRGLEEMEADILLIARKFSLKSQSVFRFHFSGQFQQG